MVEFEHINHIENRFGAQLRSGPPSFGVSIWVAPETDLGVWKEHWHPHITGRAQYLEHGAAAQSLDSQKRYVRAYQRQTNKPRKKYSGYVELTPEASKYDSAAYEYAKEQGSCQALIHISSGKREDGLLSDKPAIEYMIPMSDAFERAADACLDLALHR